MAYGFQWDSAMCNGTVTYYVWDTESSVGVKYVNIFSLHEEKPLIHKHFLASIHIIYQCYNT